MALKECIASKAKKESIIDVNSQKELVFYIVNSNKKDIFYNGKLVDIQNNEFKISTFNLEGYKTITFKDLQGDEVSFNFWFSNRKGQIKDYPLFNNELQLINVKTLRNTLILYSNKDRNAFNFVEKYFNKLPINFTSNIKMIKMIPYGNKQNIAGTTKDEVTTLYDYKSYTIAEKKNILYHEIAHTWANKLMDKKYIDYSYTDYQEIIKKDGNYVSSYAAKFANEHKDRPSEDFADGMAFYLIDENKFTKKYPNRAKYFKELLRKTALGGQNDNN